MDKLLFGVTVLNYMIIQNILTNHQALNLSHVVWGNWSSGEFIYPSKISLHFFVVMGLLNHKVICSIRDLFSTWCYFPAIWDDNL